MTLLQDRLIGEYNASTFLTGANISGSYVSFEPNSKAVKEYKPRSLSDRLITPERLRVGEPSRSVGYVEQQNLTTTLTHDGAFFVRWLIKKPGETTHWLPKELGNLAPALQQIANEEFATNPNAKNDLAYITYRQLPLFAGKVQVGGQWHAHAPITASKDEDAFLFMMSDTAPMNLDKNERPSGLLKETEYMLSDKAGTYVQTKTADIPFEIRVTKGIQSSIVGAGLPTTHFKQAADFEIVQGSSLVYHKADKIDESYVGGDRNFLLACYATTGSTERQMRLAA